MVKSENSLNDIAFLVASSWNLLDEKIDLSNLQKDLSGYQLDGDCLAVSFAAFALDNLCQTISSRSEFVEKIKPFLFRLDKETDKDIFIF